MPDGHISFAPLADAVDTLISSIDVASLSRRRQRTVRTLSFQSRTLRSVVELDEAKFRRADWAVGQQAVIAIPLLVRILRQRSNLSPELALRCVQEASGLAAQLTAVAEGRHRTRP